MNSFFQKRETINYTGIIFLTLVSVILAGCIGTQTEDQLPVKEWDVTGANCRSDAPHYINILIPKTMGYSNDYVFDYNHTIEMDFSRLVSIPNHTVVFDSGATGVLKFGISPPLNPLDPNDQTVFFDTSLVFYEYVVGVFGGRNVSAKCYITTPSSPITFR
jgi:hypothetical protein